MNEDRLSYSARALLAHLRGRAVSFESSMKALSIDAGIPVRTLFASLRTLQGQGFVTVTRRGYAVYRITLNIRQKTTNSLAG